MAKMSKAVVIKKFLEMGKNGKPTSVAELMEMKKSCTSEEWTKMAKDAAEATGDELE